MPQYSGWKVKTPSNPFLPFGPILSTMPFDWGSYGGVLYGIHPMFLNYETKLSSQNSSALSVTTVLGTPFLANIVLNICLTVVASLCLTFITSGQPEKKSTKIKKANVLNMCMVYMDPCPWGPLFGPRTYFGLFKCFNLRTLRHLLKCSSTSSPYHDHQACNISLLWVAATPPCISSCTLSITSFLKFWGSNITSVLNIKPLSTVNFCRASLKGLSAIGQLLHTFFLMRSSIPLGIGSCWVSLLSVLRDSTSVSTHSINLRIFMFLSIFTLKS